MIPGESRLLERGGPFEKQMAFPVFLVAEDRLGQFMVGCVLDRKIGDRKMEVRFHLPVPHFPVLSSVFDGLLEVGWLRR